MDFDENNLPEDQEGEYVEIYSKRAIFWFSVLGSPIFGGALLAYNLKTAGHRKGLYIVGTFTVLFTVISSLVIYQYVAIYKINLNVDFRNPNVDPHFLIFSLIALGWKLIAGFTLTQYFFPKYFPEDDYYPKSIAKPLLIAAAILIPYMIIASRIKM